jgi:Ala-tRNA(Pro) deacylase
MPTKKIAKPKVKDKPADKKIIKYLEKQGVKFELVPHRKVFTAYDLAQTAGAKLDDIAKSLLVKVELPELKKKGKYYVVVVPASYNIDLSKVKKALKAKSVELAPEKVFKKLGIEPGAISPFGSQRDFGVLVDKGMLKAKEAILGAESFIESIKMKVNDLVELEDAVVDSVSHKNKLKLQQKSAPAKKIKKSATKKLPAKGKVAAKKKDSLRKK